MAELETSLVRPPRKDKKAYRRWHYLTNKQKALAQGKEWYSKNRERKLKTNADYIKAHPEVADRSCKKWRAKNKERMSLRCKAYRAKHHEQLKESQRQSAKLFYQTHKSEVLSRNKQWRDNNPEYILHQSQKRRALKKAATINQKQILAWMKAVKSRTTAICYYCSTITPTDAIHFDHIVALSKGGPHCVENLCVSCPDCNLQKGDKALRVWTKVGQQMLEL